MEDGNAISVAETHASQSSLTTSTRLRTSVDRCVEMPGLASRRSDKSRPRKLEAPTGPLRKVSALPSLNNSVRQVRRRKSIPPQVVRNNNNNGTHVGTPIHTGSRRTKQRRYNHDSPSTEDQKKNIVNFLLELYDLGIEGILNQYKSGLLAYVPDGITRTMFDKNQDKNRYKDVICVDGTRVVLNDGGENDYIHANHIPDSWLVNRFICTQGPMANTVGDFWRMIMQEKVETIFMLCETIELGKSKCHQYWPLRPGSTAEFGDIVVKNFDVDSRSDSATIITTLEATRNGETVRLKHHQWRTWPDRSVPQSVMAPFKLLKKARNSQAATVVHCSAGVGRTGTIVALEICLQRLLAGQACSVLTVVQQMRTMRMHAVQTDLQLVFINKCLSSFALSKQLVSGDLRSKHDKFEEDYSRLIADRARPEAQPGYTPLVPTVAQPVNVPEYVPLNTQTGYPLPAPDNA